MEMMDLLSQVLEGILFRTLSQMCNFVGEHVLITLFQLENVKIQNGFLNTNMRIQMYKKLNLIILEEGIATTNTETNKQLTITLRYTIYSIVYRFVTQNISLLADKHCPCMCYVYDSKRPFPKR